MFNLKTPISKVASVIQVRSEGLGLNATGRCFGVSKEAIKSWEERFSGVKNTLKLYHVCHKFIKLTFEGDELYTRVHHNRPASESEGWTAILLERASRFILAAECGPKDESLFMSVIEELSDLSKNCKDMSLFTDGERRYGNILFDLCHIWIGKKGQAVKALPPQIQVRIKNKSSARKSSGRPKYQSPWLETALQKIDEMDIQANHVEAFNASLRRRNSAYRRRSNTYAKSREGLQRTLDRETIIHNYVRPHFTTGKVPAVMMGIMKKGLQIEDILTLQQIAA